jgi:hypothetical protein
VSQPPGPPELDRAIRRELAVGLFNHVWTLLEIPERTPDEDDEMVHAAHASRYHWGEVGDERNRAVGEWQCSRVYATIGRGEPAVVHARRCLDLVRSHALDHWLHASAREALARAHAVAGDGSAAARWKAAAQAALAQIVDADERQIVEADIATLPV